MLRNGNNIIEYQYYQVTDNGGQRSTLGSCTVGRKLGFDITNSTHHVLPHLETLQQSHLHRFTDKFERLVRFATELLFHHLVFPYPSPRRVLF